ncbi:cupredoxin domain-containing protein [Aspergillus novofumigatus IBT 16806]|uniref:Cupredoxin n=1 Tax=Aspergillus novofumigatus (strain IBT 16806) TaxID=1392255 RepID=A0A2I1BTU7_ASPN1|nr:Cupredoxin [Aspergillus novofumigatus IBT 16806]PKX88818.1 Cupredoxin [Aspergillus novofumigatus IBT 16806]
MAGALNLILAMSWLSLIYAQSGGQATTTSSSAASAVHTVDVGEHGLTFDPDTLSVSPGSKVEFHFYPGNHAVAQGAFSKPCHPFNQSSFFSGFIPATDGESPEVFTLTVNDTNPIWYYCPQVGHCQAGMVGVINPPRNGPDTLDAFKSAAKDAGDTTVPAAVGGGTLGKPSTASTTSSGTSQTMTSTGSSTSSSATTSSSSNSGSSSTSTATSTSSSSPSPTSEGSRFCSWSSLSIVMLLSVFAAMLIS